MTEAGMSAGAEDIEVIGLDLDGTTLRSDHQLSAVTIATINRLLKTRDVSVVIATGRSSSCVGDVAKAIEADAVPCVCSNGTVGVVMRKDGTQEKVFVQTIPTVLATRAIEFADRFGCLIQVYDEAGEIFCSPVGEAQDSFRRRYATMTGHTQKMVPSLYTLAAHKSFTKMLLMAEKPTVLSVELEAEFGDSMHKIMGSPAPSFFVELLPRGLNKGEGFKRMCQHLGRNSADSATFGDGPNDKEFLELSRDSIAVGNAGAVARSAARRISQYTNDQDAVARELQRLDEEGRFKPLSHP